MPELHPHPRRTGFTLIEVLAAGIILAMVAAVIGTALSHAYGALADSRDERRAALLLDELLTKVDLIGPARLAAEGPRQGRFSGDDKRFSWSLEIRNRPQGHLFEVTATVTWLGRERERALHIQTYLDDPPNSRDPTLKWRDL